MLSGFKASDIGQYGIGDLTWWEPSAESSNWYDVPIPMGALFDIFEPWRDPPTRESVSGVYIAPQSAETGDSDPEVAGDSEVLDETSTYVIDPEFRPEYTVYENAPGGIYETNRRPTDWDAYYDRYVVLNPEEEVAIDWGELATQVIGGFFGQQQSPGGTWAPSGIAPVQSAMAGPGGAPAGIGITGGTAMVAAGACGPTGPKYGKICLATGVVTPLRRRRRRRLLTSSDIKDLSALKSIVGGAALQGAVVQAVRR